MKSFVFSLLLLLLPVTLHADILPPNMKPLALCVQVEGLSQWPDMTLVAAVWTISGEIETWIVQEDTCLDAGYKFNQLYLLGIPSKDMAGVDSQTLPKELLVKEEGEYVAPQGQPMDVWGGYVDMDETLARKTETWGIVHWSPREPVELRLLRTELLHEDGSVSTIESQE